MVAYEGFHNLYSQSKTLRNELIPVGRTLEYIQQRGILDEDIHRAESYKKVKKIIDKYHKVLIDKALEDVCLDNLDMYMDLYCRSNRDAKQEKEFEKIQDNLRKQIVKALTGHPLYKNKLKEFIKEDLQAFLKDQKEDLDVVKEFEEYTTYFTGFCDNRKNMYSDEAKSTAIAYRLIHQNLPKFIDNLRVFREIKSNALVDNIKLLESKLKDKIGIEEIDEFFEIGGFNKVLTQRGIDAYNTILGAYSEDGGIKVKGLNEYINEYNQHEKIKKNKLPKMKPLFKQILSDRGTASFVIEKFDTDKEVCDAIKAYGEFMIESIVENEDQTNLQPLLEQIATYQIEGIYKQ
ncbi:MAG: type V CRISPR-associated protein Cas12a/Cpf1 [Lachnospiraceae bacterium]|nr:type V CRISPR-associated protein Cas12a/Cpf1 [Lachnospiraceae bacterium]MBR1853097.1 type V CRISPR-associated protein Cas12a/Cpf1 [Lachnospiraceae bacterium]